MALLYLLDPISHEILASDETPSIESFVFSISTEKEKKDRWPVAMESLYHFELY